MNEPIIKSNIEKGKEVEFHFKQWLDKHNIPYFYIKQEKESFSQALDNSFRGKRPDFMILIPNLGFILVDTKNRRIHPTYKTYPIDSDETKKYSSVQRRFNMPIWYVISNEDFDYKTWLWIPVSKVLEEGIPRFNSSKSKEDFYAVPPEEFTQIADNDSLDRLFTKSFSE